MAALRDATPTRRPLAALAAFALGLGALAHFTGAAHALAGVAILFGVLRTLAASPRWWPRSLIDTRRGVCRPCGKRHDFSLDNNFRRPFTRSSPPGLTVRQALPPKTPT